MNKFIYALLPRVDEYDALTFYYYNVRLGYTFYILNFIILML